MSWFGTLIGSSLGFLFGGPLGAIGGAALGHLFIDRPIQASARATQFNTRERRQAGYFVALFSIMGKIAGADGHIAASERRIARQFIAQAGMQQTQAQYALRIFEEAAQSPHSVKELATQFYTLTPGRSTYHLSFMDLLARLAYADGVLDTTERNLLQQVATALHINERDFNLILNRAEHAGYGSAGGAGAGAGYAGAGAGGASGAPDTALQSAYRALGCTPQSNDAAIRSAYRRLASAYHPDKIISKDLPDEFTELAKTKFQEIHGAYQKVKAARGMN